MGSVSLLADRTLELREPQRRAVEAGLAGPVSIRGGPGSGKTTILAEIARTLARRGPVLVICSHAASCEAFRGALGETGAETAIDTLEGHLSLWMRSQFASAGVAAGRAVGADADSVLLLRRAARDVLDMTWPGLDEEGFSLDVPFLRRPDTFFELSASLFRQLRRGGVTPDAFEAGCRAGSSEFYGDGVDAALASCSDDTLRRKASKRGRDAMAAPAASLAVQKKAERDLSILLAHCYRRYRDASASARVLSADDIVDDAISWLREDRAAAGRIAAAHAGVIVDDAEDAHPQTEMLLELLDEEGLRRFASATCEAAAIDGIGGRRAFRHDAATVVDLGQPAPHARRTVARANDESDEADSIGAEIVGLLASGVEPRDVAVLARDADGAAAYAALLAGRGVPVTETLTRWQSPHEIADLLALCAIVDDPFDQAHLLRVLSSPLVALSDSSLRTLCRDRAERAQLTFDAIVADERARTVRAAGPTTLADNTLSGAADHLLAEGARSSVEAFRTFWAAARLRWAGAGLGASIAGLAQAAGFRDAWQRRPAHLRERLADDLERLVSAAARWSRDERQSVAQTLRAIEDGDVLVRPARRSRDAVACLTILESKGIRFRHAFVAGVAFERFPRIYTARPLAFSRRYGIIARENVASGASQTAKFAWYYTQFDAKGRFLEEERRALAFAMSRGVDSTRASGFGKPPRWAAGQDLLADLEMSG